MKRLFAILLCLCMLPLGGMADAMSVAMPLTTGGSAQIAFSPDALSLPDTALRYDHDLCKLTFQLAVSSFGLSGEAPDASVTRFLKAFGFEDVVTAEYDFTSPDTIGTAMGIRTQPDGQPLVAVAIRSSNYGQEWVSNFDSSLLEQHHRGFYLAAETVVERLRDYLSRHGLSQMPLIWITGYSRGAAVANVSAALMDESGLSADEKIYAYTFATPATVQAQEAKKHANIFNILQYGDIVTHVPLKGWGFERYGTSLYLPTSKSMPVYDAFLPAYQEAYRLLNHTEDAFAHDGECVLSVERAVQVLLKTVPTVAAYQATYEPIFKKLFLQEELSPSEGMLAGLLLSNVLGALDPENAAAYAITADFTALDINSVISLLLPCAIKHMPESYWAFLSSLTDEKVLFENPLSILP